MLANLTVPYGSPTMLGGGTITAVYNPPIGTSVYSHSISQTWTFSAFPYPEVCDTSCSGPDCLQSVEIGWNVDATINAGPDPYGTHLFIYSTSDDYTSTGCYNGFQATNGGACLQGQSLGTGVVAGMALSYNYGLYPAEVQFDTYNYEGNWYLAVNGTTAFVYYGDQYDGSFGTSAGAFQVGGEVEAPSTFDVPSESDSWYPGDGVGMGSGYCAESDQAGYHRASYFYFDGGGGAIDWWIVALNPVDYAPAPHLHVGILLRLQSEQW